MSAYESGRSIEARSLAILLPFLQSRAHDDRFVMCNKGPMAKAIQETVGDVIVNTDEGTIYTVEIKAEQSWTGNLFLETWSNKNLNDRDSHAQRGGNPGWLLKLRADYLFYHFLDADLLLVIDFFLLKRWAFGSREPRCDANLYRYREVPQSKYAQLNDTWGRIVPVADIESAVPVKRFKPLEMQRRAA